jgi:26S proteasome regulatory subunit N9
MPRDVRAYLLNKISCADDEKLSKEWSDIEELHSRRLWHQLALKIQAFIQYNCFEQTGLLEMYECFISDFEHKINPLSLVDIAVVVSKEINGGEEAITFLKNIREKVRNDRSATILCMTALGTRLLQQNKFDELKVVLDETNDLLVALNGITAVHAQFFELSSSYNKEESNFEAYYRDALRYLGFVDTAAMPASEQSERAFHLGLAALLAENVYNFGEILSHSVMESLRGTERTWMVKLLFAFNTGDLSQFEALRPFWEQQPDLFKNQGMLLKKIHLLSVMELIFRRPAHDRTIPFSAIASGAQINISEVEKLVMKALSLDLIKGSIDQVLQETTMTWVQPRVFDSRQV